MISWKYSLDKINGELELAKKKREALEKLLNEGKVSQPTYDSFSNEVAAAIAEIETRQTVLSEKMTAKIGELEQQMKTLEFLLVNSEIRHVSGESEEETYNRENDVLSLGLETTRQELNEIKEAISSLSENLGLPPPPPKQEETEVEPETEKRLEIVMDTETTTSIETTVEEQPTVEEETEVPVETDVEQEEIAESPVEEVQQPSENEETELSEEAETEAASEATADLSSEDSNEENTLETEE